MNISNQERHQAKEIFQMQEECMAGFLFFLGPNTTSRHEGLCPWHSLENSFYEIVIVHSNILVDID